MASATGEATLEYHPVHVRMLNAARYPGCGPYQVGSLTGAVASQTVTEARKGTLPVDSGNHPLSVSV